jgi:hypothetical protein
VKLRPATENDIRAWFGNVPATMRAIVVEDGDEVLGVAGISTMADHLQAWSDFRPRLREHPYLLARAAVEFRRMLRDAPGVVLALCSQTEPTAPALLAKLGFVQYTERGWRHG